MEYFDTNEPQIEGSSIENPNDPPSKRTKTIKQPPAVLEPPIKLYTPEFQGAKDNFTSLEKPQNEISDSEIGIKDTDLENYGNVYKGQNIDKMRAEYQSNWDRLGNLGARVISNVIGGTVSSIGSVPAIAEGVVDEIRGKDADFTNSVVEFGNEIKNWAKDNFPNYKKNPNESWDVSDPAFWFNGVESAFSTLEFLGGAYGATKGVGAIAKLLKAEKALQLVGANTEKLKLGAKIATGALFSRNAENMMESFQLVKDTKQNLLSEWESDPESFNKIKDSEVARELREEGRDITKENLASFIAGKAGWEAYGINSLNIGFDALQIAPLFKGFNPSTRLGKLATSSKVAEANRKVLNTTARSASGLEKTFDILNPAISGIGRSISEGVEEMVNDYGQVIGKNVVNEATGKPKQGIDVGQMTESGFWGLFGGVTFESTLQLVNKIKGIKSNTDTESRVGEIYTRVAILKEGGEKIKSVEEDDNLNDETKKEHINSIKSELALDLGLRAAQVGNIDLLLKQVQSKEYKDKLVELGIAKEIDVDKAIAKTSSDILLAEKLYKQYYNSFQTAEGSEQAKNSLINQSVVTDYFVRKNEDKKANIANELANLKVNDNYLKSSNLLHTEGLIQLEGLIRAKYGIQEFIKEAKDKKNEILSERGKEEINKIDEKITKLKEEVGEEKLDTSLINPDIIKKQTQLALLEGVNNIQGSNINRFRTKEHIVKTEKNIKDQQEARKKQDFDEFKDDIDNKVNLTSNDLESLRKDYKDSKEKLDYLDNKIKELKNKEEIKKRQEDVKEETKIDSEDLVKPSENEFDNIPEYEHSEIDESTLNPAFKTAIDENVASNNIDELRGFIGDYFYGRNPNESSYARNKVQELREKRKQKEESIELNTAIPVNESPGFEFNEFSQEEKPSSRYNLENIDSEEELEKEEDNNPFNHMSRDIASDYIRTLIVPFQYQLKNYGSKEFTVGYASKGNIIVKDEYKDQIATLLNPELTEGSEVEIVWDKDNQFTKVRGHKGDVQNEAFKLVYKGVTLGYLPTKDTTEAEIEKYKNGVYKVTKMKSDMMIERLSLELPRTIELRNKLSLTDKVYKTKLLLKGNGTIISRGTKPTALRSIKGIFKGLYALSIGSGESTLINIEDEDNRIDILKGRPGIIYGALENANGGYIPVPLFSSKINNIQAKELSKNIDKLLDLLNQGKDNNNREVQDIKDEIAKYIRVDHFNNFDKPIGFRIHTQGQREDGTTVDARIEIAYNNVEGEKRIAVLKKSLFDGESWMGVFEGDKKIFEINSEDPGFNKSIQDILRMKYHNIDFSLLNKKKPFEYNRKTYSTYKEYLEDEEILKTDIAQVLDTKGNVLGNVYGFDHDFDLKIGHELIGEELNKEQKIANTIGALFLTNKYEKELSYNDTITKDSSYKANYSIFDRFGIVDANTILTEVLNNPLNDNIKQVATWLQSNRSKILTTIQATSTLSKLENARYEYQDNRILINANRNFSELYLQQTVLHELLHAVTGSTMLNSITNLIDTYDKLRKDYEINDIEDIKFKENTPQYVKDFTLEIIELRNKVINELEAKYGKSAKQLANGNLKTFYGLENPFEFISEAIVNPNFRNELRALKGNKDLLSRIYNAIVDFINKYFGTNLNRKEEDILKNAVDLIKNFVDKQDIITPLDMNFIDQSKVTDDFDNKFSREEIKQITNTFEGVICGVIRTNKMDFIGESIDRDNTKELRNQVQEGLKYYHENLCPESCKEKVSTIGSYFNTFYNKASKRINRKFKRGSAEEIDEVQENESYIKDFDDTVTQRTSSQQTVPNEIKIFISTVPVLNSTKIAYSIPKVPIWNVKKSTITGLTEYIDFNKIYPYLVRNLIGARSAAEIISRLQNMSSINPSFAYIAFELQKDAQLLAQFDSSLAKKSVYDSYVTFITNNDYNKEIWIQDELKSTRYDIQLGNRWNKAEDKVIDKLKDSNIKLEFDKKINSINLSLTKSSKDFENSNKEELANNLWNYSNSLGVDLSFATIQKIVSGARNWGDIEKSILTNLRYINDSISRGKKTDSKKRNLELAKLEALYRYDIVENSGLDIKGNLVYAIRNSSYITNWFNNIKSETKEGREELERYLSNLALIPEMQFSNWLWNDKNKRGFINYKEVSGRKIPINTKDNKLDINQEFIDIFKYHENGGAKETISRVAQKYSDFSDNNWKLINLIAYLNLNDKSTINKGKEKDIVLIPSIIGSDSGKIGLFELPKVKLGEKGYIRNGKVVKITRNSPIFEAIYNVAKQEIRRIQQVTEQLFEIKDNKFIVKEGLDFRNLQQYYHYDKEFIYDENGKLDLTKTLLNEDGSPKGKAFYFNNMILESEGKFFTLDDIPGIKLNHRIAVGEVNIEVQNKIKVFIERCINQRIEKGIKDYKSIEVNLEGKHSNVLDGSFEALIAEYIMNHFIANVEQFNFFNGNIAEYKSKVDTNKRAKQLFTPSIKLSEENMKIKYQNGSRSNGISFTGITLKDIENKSHTIDWIINTIKNQIIKEKTYSKEEISTFTLKPKIYPKNFEFKNSLDKDVYEIVKPYIRINAGDAQGYCTLDRYEMVLRGRGELAPKILNIINKARRGEILSLKKVKSLQPLKGFYYGRDYDKENNKLTSVQIKFSELPLVPQMVKGSELEKLMNEMNKRAIDIAFFESAAKVGAKAIYKIDNEDGTINEKVLEDITPTNYLNSNYGVQLDTPEHLYDTENLLATQISKLIIANLDPNTKYNVNGKDYDKDELLRHYFNIWKENILDSKEKLLKDLKIEQLDNGKYKVKDIDIQKLLIEESDKRGLSDNYNFAIELDERGQFKLPLFTNNMVTKWEAILTSLFTNRITKQKVPGGSAVLGSRLFIDKAINQEDVTSGIKWSKEKEGNQTLKSFHTEDGKTKVVEVLLSGWSKHLYKNGELMNIDEIPEDLRTMIGYRIPTTSKAYMTVFKVVGFLPEESKGLIVTPDDMVAQMGQDFDIDKWFIMNKDFYRTRKDNFIVPNMNNTKEQFESLQEDVKGLRMDLEITPKDVTVKSLADALAKTFNTATSAELEKELDEKVEYLKQFGKYNEDGSFEFNNIPSRSARNNEIFNIYKSILSNPSHFKEILTPSGYRNLTDLKDEISTIFGIDDKFINPLTEEGQRTFRRRNVAGKALTGIAANLNAFGSIAQITKMELTVPFKFKVDTKNLSNNQVKDLIDRYEDDIQLDEEAIATINFKKLGYAPDGSYLNTNGELILEVASEGVVAAVDNAKDPVLETLNLTSYTYPLYHVGVLVGVPIRTMGMFIRQPIIKMINDYYFENKSLLVEDSGDHIETIKRYYQTYLYIELRKQGKLGNVLKGITSRINEVKEQIKDTTNDRKKKDLEEKLDKLNKKYTNVSKTIGNAEKRIKLREKFNIQSDSLDKKYLMYIGREEAKEILQYNPDELKVFSVEELKNNLKLAVAGYSKRTLEDKVNYYKDQLQIVEYFNRWNKTTQEVQDLLKATKTDSIGAGPSMDTTTELFKNIDKLRNKNRVVIGENPAIFSLYPNYLLGIDKESAYPPLEVYLENSNKLSVDILNNLFINQTLGFQNIKSVINGVLTPINALKEDEVKALNKFLNVSILKQFDKFSALQEDHIMGIDQSIITNINISIEPFKKLSTANKVAILKDKHKDILSEDTQHILNFLTPLVDEDTIKRLGYHKLDFLFYKNDETDDNLADSIAKMIDVGNEFEKDLGESLINYALVTNGLTYGINSFSKVIPSETLYNWGLGQYLRDTHSNFLTGSYQFNTNMIDYFFRNNYNNSNIVPNVRTKWDYYKDEAGRKRIKRDLETNSKLTKDRSPVWNITSPFITVSNRSLKTLGEKVRNSPYVLVYDRSKNKGTNEFETKIILYKKYIEQVSQKDGSLKTISEFENNVYYYPIGKLGKDGILEYSDKSIFKENNVNKEEKELRLQIQNVVHKIDQQSNQLKTKNSSKDDIDNAKNNCKI